MHESVETAAPALQGMLYRSPELFGLPRSKWWLDGIIKAASWLSVTHKGVRKPISRVGMHRLLRRLGVTYKQGRVHVHSPDKQYEEKLARIQQAQARCRAEPTRSVFLYEDEHTICRNPSACQSYAAVGGQAQRAEQARGYNSTQRIAGCVDLVTGAVIARQRSHYTVKEMARFFLLIERCYPQAEVIYIALDNWPVHFHPYVLETLAAHHSRIQLLPLPTYAPWTNPIEKVWRLFNQQVALLHRYQEDWQAYRLRTQHWLDDLRAGSQELLYTIGLNPSFKQTSRKST